MKKSLSLPIYDLSGNTTGTIELNPTVFGVTAHPDLIHQVVVAHQANRRATTANTKDRAEVRGGGKKPWRQKGTGNARAGSSRSPLWRGGGVTFGPSADRNYTQRLPQKMRQVALKGVLSSKVATDNLIILDTLNTLDGKTKSWVSIVGKLPKTSEKVLVVSNAKDAMADRAIRNLPTQKYVSLEGLTVFDLLRFPVLILTKDAIDALTTRLATVVAAPAPVKAKKKSAETAAVSA
jgi:large subunit ribosomal protein L4